MSYSTPAVTARQGVSLAPSRYHDGHADAGPLTLADLASFNPTGDRETRLSISLPAYVHRSIEGLTLLAGRRSPNVVLIAVLEHGLTRLINLPEVGALCDARTALLRLGSPDAALLDDWNHSLSGGEVLHRMHLRNLSKALRDRLSGRAHGLGLSLSAFASLAAMASLIDAGVPGDGPRRMLGDLRAFRLALRDRAETARELVARARQTPTAPRAAISWAEVAGD
jgi:hypothetical protein